MTNILTDFINTLKEAQKDQQKPRFTTWIDNAEKTNKSGAKTLDCDLSIFSRYSEIYLLIPIEEAELNDHYSISDLDHFIEKIKKEIKHVKTDIMIKESFFNKESQMFEIPYIEYESLTKLVQDYKNMESEFQTFQMKYLDNEFFKRQIAPKKYEVKKNLSDIKGILYEVISKQVNIRKIELLKNSIDIILNPWNVNLNNTQYFKNVYISLDIQNMQREELSLKEITDQVSEAFKHFKSDDPKTEKFFSDIIYKKLISIFETSFKEQQIYETILDTLKDIEIKFTEKPIDRIPNFSNKTNLIKNINSLGQTTLQELSFDFLPGTFIETNDFFNDLNDITKETVLEVILNEIEFVYNEDQCTKEEEKIIHQFKLRIEEMVEQIKKEESKTKKPTLVIQELEDLVKEYSKDLPENYQVSLNLEIK